MARTKKFVPGDLVRYTAKFRRSVGMVAGGPIDGIVVGSSWMGPIVLWSDREIPITVAEPNLQKKKTTRSPDDLLSAARLAIGIPVGKPGGYRIYTGRPGKLKQSALLVDVHEALLHAEKIYDEPGTGNVIVLGRGGSVLMSLAAEYGASPNPKGKTMARTKRGKRKSNTHDPQRSTKNFEAAVKAADRDLVSAVDAMERNRPAQSLKQLMRVSYWVGQARAERPYASRIDPGWDKRLREIEDGMPNWGKNFLDWQAKAS